jgi:hypothetical protein
MGPSIGLRASKPFPYKVRGTSALPQTVRRQVYLHPGRSQLATDRRSLATSPANLSVAPLLPPAGHWYLHSGAKRFR